MKQLNCDFLQITIEFDAKQFKRKEFILDVGKKNAKEDVFLFSFGSKAKSRNEQAQSLLTFNGKNSALRLAFRPEKIEAEDSREPYLEDVVSWFSQFFSEKEMLASITSVFKFNQQYESLIQFRYPLLIANDLLRGVTITGHDLEFPSDSEITKASISVTDKGFLIFLHSQTKFDLSQFDVHNTIEKFSKYANALMKKKEDKNAKNK